MIYFVVFSIIVIYIVIIKSVKSGRCFRKEFIIKSLIILFFYILNYVLLSIHFTVFPIYFLIIVPIITLPVLMVLSLKWTIQRFYDLNLSGWFLLLKLIPIATILVTIYLFLKEGNFVFNKYDKAIDYRKLFKSKHCINICERKLVVDNVEYKYERYLDKFIIKIPKYSNVNIFTNYLIEKYPLNTANIYDELELKREEFNIDIQTLGLIVIENSNILNIKNFKLFIRKENFKFTVLLDKKLNIISKDLFDTFNFPGSFFEDEQFVYYKTIEKKELIDFVNNLL